MQAADCGRERDMIICNCCQFCFDTLGVQITETRKTDLNGTEQTLSHWGLFNLLLFLLYCENYQVLLDDDLNNADWFWSDFSCLEEYGQTFRTSVVLQFV